MTAQAIELAAPAEPIEWLLALPYPLRNALRRWRSLAGMTVGVGIALSIGMTLLAVIGAEMDLLTGDYARSGVGLYVVTDGGKLVARLAGETPGSIQNGTTTLAQMRSWSSVQSAVGALTWTMTRQDEGPTRRAQPRQLISVVGVNGDPALVPGLLELYSGRWLRNTNDIVVGRTLARTRQLSPGDTIRLDDTSFVVVGIGRLRGFSAFGQDAVAYMSDSTLRRKAQLGGAFNVIAIQTQKPDEVRSRIDELGGLSASTPDELITAANEANASGITIDWILILLTLAIAGLFVATMLNHSVTERRAEFAVLRAIGVPASSVVMTVALEAVAITVVAGALGVGISLCFGWLIDTLVAKQYGIDSLYKADPSLYLLIFALAAGLGLISGIVPARKAARVDPVEVLREV